jgi:hypothetical protein
MRMPNSGPSKLSYDLGHCLQRSVSTLVDRVTAGDGCYCGRDLNSIGRAWTNKEQVPDVTNAKASPRLRSTIAMYSVLVSKITSQIKAPTSTWKLHNKAHRYKTKGATPFAANHEQHDLVLTNSREAPTQQFRISNSFLGSFGKF